MIKCSADIRVMALVYVPARPLLFKKRMSYFENVLEDNILDLLEKQDYVYSESISPKNCYQYLFQSYLSDCCPSILEKTLETVVDEINILFTGYVLYSYFVCISLHNYILQRFYFLCLIMLSTWY
jgi:hypothetical protein